MMQPWLLSLCTVQPSEVCCSYSSVCFCYVQGGIGPMQGQANHFLKVSHLAACAWCILGASDFHVVTWAKAQHVG
jgi:hypothetical protein